MSCCPHCGMIILYGGKGCGCAARLSKKQAEGTTLAQRVQALEDKVAQSQLEIRQFLDLQDLNREE